MLPLLHLLQEHFGYISTGRPPTGWLKKLDLQPINVLEVVTFYPMFRAAPPGRHHIRVCRTLSCAMAGSYKLLDDLCEMAHIERPQARRDTAPRSRWARTASSPSSSWNAWRVAATAPVCMVNDDFYEGVNKDAAAEILQKYQ